MADGQRKRVVLIVRRAHRGEGKLALQRPRVLKTHGLRGKMRVIKKDENTSKYRARTRSRTS